MTEAADAGTTLGTADHRREQMLRAALETLGRPGRIMEIE